MGGRRLRDKRKNGDSGAGTKVKQGKVSSEAEEYVNIDNLYYQLYVIKTYSLDSVDTFPLLQINLINSFFN